MNLIYHREQQFWSSTEKQKAQTLTWECCPKVDGLWRLSPGGCCPLDLSEPLGHTSQDLGGWLASPKASERMEQRYKAEPSFCLGTGPKLAAGEADRDHPMHCAPSVPACPHSSKITSLERKQQLGSEIPVTIHHVWISSRTLAMLRGMVSPHLNFLHVLVFSSVSVT